MNTSMPSVELQDIISLTTLIPGTVFNLFVSTLLLLSPHRGSIPITLLTIFSVTNSLICLQITPLAAASFTSKPLVDESQCFLLIPIYNITSNLSTFFLAALAVDIGLSLVYKTERLMTRCKFVMICVVYLTLLVLVETMQMRFEVEVQYTVSRGVCSWTSPESNLVTNYINIGSLIAVITPVFLIALSLVSITCNFRTISTYNHTLLNSARATLLLSVSFLTFHSVGFVVSLKAALLPLLETYDNDGQMHHYDRIQDVLLNGIYSTIAPLLIYLAIPDIRHKFRLRVGTFTFLE